MDSNHIINKEKNLSSEHKLCCCYSKKSYDMRACGLCYTFCNNPNELNQCYFCPKTFNEYYRVL